MKTSAVEDYIPPTLNTYKSLEDLLKPKSDEFTIADQFAENIDLPTVQSLSKGMVKAFILADPGYGKSELLGQVEKQGNALGRGAILKDLKDTSPTQISACYKEDIVIYCFDALDEVRYDQYQATIAALHRFAKDHSEVSILISCRRHDAANNRSKFLPFDGFQFIEITPFDYPMIEKYIKQAGIEDEALIKTLFSRARPIQGKISILSIPRYLKAIVALIRDKRVTEEQVKSWKRKDFFEQFIYTRLEEAEQIKEGNKGHLRQNEKEITKRVLEKLALVMEIYQVNSISKDEFISFLDGVQSNVNLVFLNICDIDIFFKRVLETRVESGEEYIAFNNTEFQEYLAAKELDRVARNPQAIYDLVMQAQFANIYSNWYDVLRYLVEIRPEVILSIVEYLNQKHGLWVESGYWDILSGVNPEELTESDRAKVFEQAFAYVQHHKGTFIISNRVNIGQFYVSANYPLIKEPILPTDEESASRLFNQINVIKVLIVKDLLDGEEKKKWQQLLMEFALWEKYEVIQKNSIIALHYFDDLELLKKIKEVFKSGNAEIRRTFIRACYKVDSNADFSVGFFFNGLSQRVNCLASEGINSITAPSQLAKVLKAFAENGKLLAGYIEESTGYASPIRWKLVDHLKASWDPVFEEPLEIILKKLLDVRFLPIRGKEEFVDKLIELLGQQDEKFICQLADFSTVDLISTHHRTLRKILRPAHTKSFVERFLKKNQSKEFVLAKYIFRDFYTLKENQPEINAIYEAGRTFLAKQYQQWEMPREEQLIEQPTEEWESEIFSKFKKMLESSPEYVIPDLFNYFLNNEETIRKHATPGHFERLRTELTNRIARIKPETMLVEIEVKNAVRKEYRLTEDLKNVEVYLRLAAKLQMSESISISRKTLLALLPLQAQQDPGKAPNSQVIHLLGQVSPEEEDYLYQFAIARNDDYLKINPVGFSQVVKFLKLEKLVSILQAFVNDDELMDVERVQVFIILASSFPEKDYLKDTFLIYEKQPRKNLQKIAYLANEALITKFHNEEALQWRLETLKHAITSTSPRDFAQQQAAWVYSVFDIRGNLAHLSTLMPALQDERYIPYFYDLLAFALKQLEANTDYIPQCFSLFEVVTEFFLGLKERSNGYGVLQDLFQFLDEEKFKNTKHFFGKYRLQLEVEYAKLYDKPRSIQFAINTYNQVKAKNYLPIYNSRDLLLLIKEVIREDIQRFVYQEGFYSVVKYLTGPKAAGAYPNEDHVQKVLSVQFENALLKRGLRETDIYREPQLLDNKRPDFVIKYGFIKPIVIEIKLLKNPEITNLAQRTRYKEKLQQYMKAANAKYGIYLIFKVKEGSNDQHFYDLRKEYQDIKGLDIPDFIDCTVNRILK